MNNKDVCTYFKTLDIDTEYVADKLVVEGKGQNCGGYIDSKNSGKNQLKHFLYYYDNVNKDAITYSYLRCPQLIIFIAEAAGAPQAWLDDACGYVRMFDKQYDIQNGRNRNGNYMWKNKGLGPLKQKLHFAEICSIIKKATSWDDVVNQVRKIK